MWHVLSVGATREGCGFTMNLCFHSWSVSRRELWRHSRSSRSSLCSKKTADCSFGALNHEDLTDRVVSRGTNINTQQHQYTHHTSGPRCILTEPVKSARLLECEILERRLFSVSSVDVKLRASFELFLQHKPRLNLHLEECTVWCKGSEFEGKCDIWQMQE